jgi:hypothetical protein
LDPASNKKPITVNICLILFLVTALLWFAFSIFVALGGNSSYARIGVFKWIMVGLTFAASLIIVGLWALLRKHFKPAWYFSVLMLAAMTIAGFLDELGLIDFLFIFVYLVMLILLIKDRRWYLANSNAPISSK